METFAVNRLQLAPLGAGDLIDRTVRLYRRHFTVLIRAVAPPVILSSIGWVLWSVSVRSIVLTQSTERLFLYVMLAAGGLALAFVGHLGQLIVMGGASRNLVVYLLRGEPVTARLIYRSVRSRFWALLGASLAIALYLFMAAVASLVVFYISLALAGIGMFVFASTGETYLSVIFLFAVIIIGLLLAIWLFFLLAGRAAYVAQALMVEGRGVFAAIGRSVALARGNTWRLIVMFLFTFFASYSALLLLLIPLGWVGFLLGIDPFEMDASRLPAWYSISYQVVVQMSTILLAPVWMMGLSLLYVDERVRHEGYDIELLAAQRLGEMPELPPGLEAPLAAALAEADAPARGDDDEERFPGSPLGLSER